MKIIWKYEIKPYDMLDVMMPVGAQVLSVQMQRGTPCMWALVDPGAPKVARTFFVYGTGHPVTAPDNKRFVGTFQMDNGLLVFHLFELAKP